MFCFFLLFVVTVKVHCIAILNILYNGTYMYTTREVTISAHYKYENLHKTYLLDESGVCPKLALINEFSRTAAFKYISS